MFRILAGLAAVAAATASLSGCTGGAVVDPTFKTLQGEHDLTWIPVNPTTRQPTGAEEYSQTTGNGVVSWDEYQPTSSNLDGTGIANSQTLIPEGWYYVTDTYPTSLGGAFATVTSPIFYHAFYSSPCRDFFSSQNDASCAEYYFEEFASCSTWQCADGAASPPAVARSGVRVIPMLYQGPGLPFGVLPAPGTIPQGW